MFLLLNAPDSFLKQIDKNVRAIQADSSKSDALFVNAGTDSTMSLESIKEQFYDDISNINVNGEIFTEQKSLLIFNDDVSTILNASLLQSEESQ